MTDPPPPTLPPGTVPAPPPPLNVKLLWLSLLAPSVLAAIGMTIFAIFINNNNFMEFLFPVACVVVCLAAIGGWVLYINVIRHRFRDASLVLLILAYPVMQVILIFGIFFVGCLAAFSRA